MHLEINVDTCKFHFEKLFLLYAAIFFRNIKTHNFKDKNITFYEFR